METGNRLEVIRAWGRRNKKLLLNEYIISVCSDETFWICGDGYTAL